MDIAKAVAFGAMNTDVPMEKYLTYEISTEGLRRSLADENDVDTHGILLLNSALSLLGINDIGREPEFTPYQLQSFAQRYL